MEIKAQESLERNIDTFNKLVEIHQGDPELMLIDSIMLTGLIITRIKNRHLQELMVEFTRESIFEVTTI